MELSAAFEFIRPRHHGVLATAQRNGRPQLSNITYSLGSDDRIRISVTSSRAKTVNTRRTPLVSLHVTRDDFYAYCVLECDVELLPVAREPDDPTVDALVDYYLTVSGEHPDWADYRRAMVADERLLLVLTPTRAYGMLGG